MESNLERGVYEIGFSNKQLIEDVKALVREMNRLYGIVQLNLCHAFCAMSHYFFFLFELIFENVTLI